MRLEGWPRWRIEPTRDVALFLRALAGLVPSGAVLYLEGGTPPPTVHTYLEERAARDIRPVEMGTIWPRPAQFHMAATAENLLGLADLAEHCASPEIAVHLHVYAGGEILLEWYDAFFDDPIYVSGAVPEHAVQAFCDRLGVTYEAVNSQA
jgi:hypothetical protein